MNFTSENIFQLGSMTIAILILEGQDKLNVNDKHTKFIPDYTCADSFNLHQLLTHTSGIKNFNKMKMLKDITQ